MDATWRYSHGVGQSRYHVVLVTYKRYGMFGRADVEKALRDIFVCISERHRFEIFEMEIVEDHVHLFVGIRPSQSIAKVMQYLKGASSREMRRLFPEMKGFSKRYLWSKGKFFRPISEVNEETIRHYITDSQGKHKHHTHSEKQQRTWPAQSTNQKFRSPQTTLDAFAS